MTDRKRTTLPEGYQYGDARWTAPYLISSWHERTGYPFTPQGIADWVDDRAAAYAYDAMKQTPAHVHVHDFDPHRFADTDRLARRWADAKNDAERARTVE